MVRGIPGASGAPGCLTAATRRTSTSPPPPARTEERTSSAPAHNATARAVLDPNKDESPPGVRRSTEPTIRQHYCNAAAKRSGGLSRPFSAEAEHLYRWRTSRDGVPVPLLVPGSLDQALVVELFEEAAHLALHLQAAEEAAEQPVGDRRDHLLFTPFLSSRQGSFPRNLSSHAAGNETTASRARCGHLGQCCAKSPIWMMHAPLVT
jgi:hypothetical protein